MLVLSTGLVASGETPIQVIQSFIGDLNRQDYKAAYALFSKPLQKEIGYLDFCRGSRDVKQIRLTKAVLFMENERIAKARLTVEGLEHTLQENPWQKRKYAGTVVFIREKRHWRFIQAKLFVPKPKQAPRARKSGGNAKWNCGISNAKY